MRPTTEKTPLERLKEAKKALIHIPKTIQNHKNTIYLKEQELIGAKEEYDNALKDFLLSL